MIPTTTTTMIDGDYDDGTLAMNDDDDDDDDDDGDWDYDDDVDDDDAQASMVVSGALSCFWMPALIA